MTARPNGSKMYFTDFDIAICSKVRDGDHRHVVLQEGSVTDRDVVIVDDLIRSGGTILECAKVLADKGARAIDVCVTHAVFPANQHERFEHVQLIRTFHTTDSVVGTLDRKFPSKFRIHSLLS